MAINSYKYPSSLEQMERRGLRNAAKYTAARLNATNGPVHCSCTLAAYEKKGVIILRYLDTFIRIDSQYHNVNTVSAPILEYNQYVEALTSLKHNCAFVLLASKFNKADHTISLQDLKAINHDYPKNILSSCSYNSHSRSFEIENLDLIVINVLKTSISIVERLESQINFESLSQNIQNFEEIHKKNLKSQENICNTAKKFVQALESGRSSLCGLKQTIQAQEDKFSK